MKTLVCILIVHLNLITSFKDRMCDYITVYFMLDQIVNGEIVFVILRLKNFTENAIEALHDIHISF